VGLRKLGRLWKVTADEQLVRKEMAMAQPPRGGPEDFDCETRMASTWMATIESRRKGLYAGE